MMEVMRVARLFLAALLPETAKDALRAAGERLQEEYPAARLTARENLHLTLLFLGETGAGETARLTAFLASRPPLEAGALRARLEGLGRFAGPQGTVFWAGLEVTPAFVDFRDSLVAGLEGLGFEMDARPFVPHITLARLKGQARGGFHGRRWMDEGAAFAFCGVSLMESVLRPEGPAYTVLWSWPRG